MSSLYDFIMNLDKKRDYTADDWSALGKGEWKGTDEELAEMLAQGYEAIA